MAKYLTAESVCKGHPDKLCDLIADSILDACLRKDKSSRVACEVMATKGKIIMAGEITCSKKVDIRRWFRRVARTSATTRGSSWCLCSSTSKVRTSPVAWIGLWNPALEILLGIPCLALATRAPFTVTPRDETVENYRFARIRSWHLSEAG